MRSRSSPTRRPYPAIWPGHLAALLLGRIVHHDGDVSRNVMRRALGGLVLLHDVAAIGGDRRHRTRPDRLGPLFAPERRLDEGRELGLLLVVTLGLVGLQ